MTSVLRISTTLFSLQFNYIHFQDTTYEIKNDANVFGLSQILIQLSLFNYLNFHFASLLTILYQIIWKQKPLLMNSDYYIKMVKLLIYIIIIHTHTHICSVMSDSL